MYRNKKRMVIIIGWRTFTSNRHACMFPDAFALHGEFQNKRNGMKGKLQAKRVWENLDLEITSKERHIDLFHITDGILSYNINFLIAKF